MEDGGCSKNPGEKIQGFGRRGGGLKKVSGVEGVFFLLVGLKRQQEMIAAITAIFKHAFPLI